MTDDFFFARLDQMIDVKHPQEALGSRLRWVQLESTSAPAFSRICRDGKVIEDIDLFGPMVEITCGGKSATGCPRESIRLMASLLYLKHAYNLIHRGKYKLLTNQQCRWLKRGQALEPAIGHLKSDNRMVRCRLLRQLGEALHAALYAAGCNLCWLLPPMVRLGLETLLMRRLVLTLLAVSLCANPFYRVHSASGFSFGMAIGSVR